ncbi:MAG: division/cell wall cluster transcriptional repressor MraZ [Clostridia bacterium]|nr:division/cell wall cluster transcriptional repressor MraZ [Clostridia bacterium]
MAYLTGYYENFVDEKGRVIMPKELKELMGSDLVLTHGLDECVYVLTRESWMELQGKLAKMPMSKGRGITHFFNTYKKDVSPDKQGRIQISCDLRRIAAIEGKAVIVGNGNRAEIWNPERFAEMEARLDTASIVAAMDELEF